MPNEERAAEAALSSSVQAARGRYRCTPASLVEREGFEPSDGCPSLVFKTSAIDHSAISPLPYQCIGAVGGPCLAGGLQCLAIRPRHSLRPPRPGAVDLHDLTPPAVDARGAELAAPDAAGVEAEHIGAIEQAERR